MLTGRPPFRSEDPLEIVHAHLARVPVSPTVVAAGVPGLLSGIVLKLLAKAPEGRYQTAAALAADLREARQRWQRAGVIEPFELGTVDLALELPISHRLYGRGPEMGKLRAAVDRVAQGAHELVLVAGDAGVGKTALVHALRDEIVRGSVAAGGGKRCRFIWGKFDMRGGNLPFASLVEALDRLIVQLLEEHEEQRRATASRILAAVGDNGRVLTELLPSLEGLIGPQPPLAALDPFEAQTRLYVTAQAFVQAFATERQPLVLFLDDIQWADTASLDAMRMLASDPVSRHLLLLGAYRSRDVVPGHPLVSFEAELKRTRAPASRIDLAPLTQKAVQDMLCEILRCEPDRAGPLADLLTAKTGGNPFFVRQLIASLHRSGQLAFDVRERRWAWSLPQIERVGITENVVELLLEAIRRLPDETRDFLAIAACVGKVAGLDALAAVSDKPEPEVHASLQPALREGLLFHDLSKDAYRFAHDCVQAAAYSVLPAARREELHLALGRLIESGAIEAVADATFEAADHFNAGVRRLGTAAERLELARLDHRAGLKAKAAAAFGPALAYLRAGLAALPGDGWEAATDLAMVMHRDAAECAYLTGDYALSDRMVEDALDHATSTIQKADLYNLRVVSAGARGAWKVALDEGQRGLAEVGYTLFSGTDIEAAIEEEEKAVDFLLHDAGPSVLLDVPLITNPTHLAILRLLVNMAHPAWWFRDRGLFRLLSFRTLRFIAEHGHGPESLTALCDVAMCLSAQDQFAMADAFGAVAQDLAWRFGPSGQQVHAQFLYAAFVQRWQHPYSWILPRLGRASEAAKRLGEMRGAAYSLSARVIFGFAAGRDLDDSDARHRR